MVRSSEMVCCLLPLLGCISFSLFKVCVFLLLLVLDSGKLQNDLQSDVSSGVFQLSGFLSLSRPQAVYFGRVLE